MKNGFTIVFANLIALLLLAACSPGSVGEDSAPTEGSFSLAVYVPQYELEDWDELGFCPPKPLVAITQFGDSQEDYKDCVVEAVSSLTLADGSYRYEVPNYSFAQEVDYSFENFLMTHFSEYPSDLIAAFLGRVGNDVKQAQYFGFNLLWRFLQLPIDDCDAQQSTCTEFESSPLFLADASGQSPVFFIFVDRNVHIFAEPFDYEDIYGDDDGQIIPTVVTIKLDAALKDGWNVVLFEQEVVNDGYSTGTREVNFIMRRAGVTEIEEIKVISPR